MSTAENAARAEFFRQSYPKMVKIGQALGASRADAEDAASAVNECIQRSWTHWAAVENKNGYLRTAVGHELDRIRQRRTAQQTREARWAQDILRSTPRDSVVDSDDHIRELDGVRQILAIASQRQREILAWLYLGQQAGWETNDIAHALGICPDTIRRHRQNARRTLAPVLTGNGHEHRRWKRAGERIHEDFYRGCTNPFGPRPIILDAWKFTRERGLNPERGTEVVLLDPSKLRQRRQQCPIPTTSLAELVDLAARNELLAVVLDTDNIVLHRGGHHDALAAADRLGYLEAACWNLNYAGVNAAGLAPILGRPTTVNRWEHTFPDQHGLCCLAIPLRIPHGGHLTLNLTATTDALTSIPGAIQRQLLTMAHRLHKQLWTPGST